MSQSAPSLDPANGLLYAVADRICRLFAGPDYDTVQAYIAALHAIGAYCPQSIADIANIGRIITFSLAAADLGTRPLDASLPLKLRLRHLILAEKLSANAASAERGMEQRRKYRRDHGGIEDFPVPAFDPPHTVKPPPQPAHRAAAKPAQAFLDIAMAEAEILQAEQRRAEPPLKPAAHAPAVPSPVRTNPVPSAPAGPAQTPVPQPPAFAAAPPITHPLATAVSQTALAAGSANFVGAEQTAPQRAAAAAPPLPAILQKILDAPDPGGLLHATIRSKMNPLAASKAPAPA